MFQYILCNKLNTFLCHHNFFTINVPYHFICNFFIHIHGFNIVYSKWKNIFIINRINDCITMKLISKRLCRCEKSCTLCFSGINRKYWCTCKPEQMIPFKIFYNCCMHISKLTSMAFIKDNDYMFFIYFMIWILFYKGC